MDQVVTQVVRRCFCRLFLVLVSSTTACAQTAMTGSYAPGIRLVSPVADGQWTMPAGDYANTRYSPLSKINTGNVGNLHLVGVMSTGIPHGHEGAPLVVGSTLYIVTPFPNNLIAYDLSKPGFPQKWIYEPHPDPVSVGIACCDVVNRGASFAENKIVYNTLDAHTVAVNAETGKLEWKTEVGDIKFGETITMAPTIVHDVVLVGDSGGELGVRGKLTALDLKTGKVLWRAFSTGSDADVRIGSDFKPFYTKDRGKDLGIKTWNPDQWKIGGGTIWGWISYDPELNLIYYGTGNPGVWNPDMRPGDNKWSITIWARDPDTGMAKWAYQIEPHDAFDYDEIMENVLVDMPWHGKVRKLLLHPGRTGFMFVMDRENGEVLSAEKFEPVTWASGFDLKTGVVQKDESKQTHFGKYTRGICPSSTGAKEFVPSSFSPKTGYLYIPAHNTCMDYAGTAVNYIAGTPYLGASVRMFPGPGGYQGEFIAWDVANAKKVWSIKETTLPVYSGVLTTGGDLAFFGTMDGWFRAVDDRSGKIIWQYKTGSGIVGNPMTFVGPDGKQYVAIYAGIGGWMGATALPSVSTDDPYAALGVVGAMKPIKGMTQPGDLLYVFSFKAMFLVLLGVQAAQMSAAALRVCADPNDLPYSNDHREGFENRLAELIAKDLGMSVEYFWFPQRQAFFRKTLRSGRCDVVMGVPVDLEGIATTTSYYRSSYVFVTQRQRHLNVESFDDPRLRTLKIGINILGESTDSVPAAHSLVLRGLSSNLIAYSIFGNLNQQNPATNLVYAVARGEVDIAVVWGPLAGFAVAHSLLPLEISPITSDPLQPDLPFAFDIAVGTRPEDVSLRQAIDHDLKKRHTEIALLLGSYGVIPQDHSKVLTHAEGEVR